MGSRKSLTDLPMELLISIAESCLDIGVISGMATTNALRATCRTLRILLTPLLLRRVYFKSYAELNTFVKHLELVPDQGKMVHDLIVGTSGSSFDEHGENSPGGTWRLRDESDAPSVTTFLSVKADCFQNLKTLQIRDAKWTNTRNDLAFKRPKSMPPCLPALESFVMCDSQYSWYVDELLAIWASPRLKFCIVSTWDFLLADDVNHKLLEREFKKRCKDLQPVEHFSLGVQLSFPEDAARYIAMARKVKSLSISETEEDTEDDWPPGLLLDAWASDLEDLDISCQGEDYQDVAYHPMHHLQRFPNLKVLTVRANWLEDICDGEVYIPPSLESLRAHGFDNQIDERVMCTQLASWIQASSTLCRQTLRDIDISLIICSNGSMFYPNSTERQKLQSLCDKLEITVKVRGVELGERGRGSSEALLERSIQRYLQAGAMRDSQLFDHTTAIDR